MVDRSTDRARVRAARWLSWATDPVVVLPMGLLIAGSSVPAASLSWWGLEVAVSYAAIPLMVIGVGAKVQPSDISHRGQGERLCALLLIWASMAVGLAGLIAFGGPPELVEGMTAVLAPVTLVTIVSSVWRISLHATAGSVLIAGMCVAGGLVWLAGTPLLAAVCWSRVILGRHTVAQVVAGSAAGALSTLAVLVALR